MPCGGAGVLARESQEMQVLPAIPIFIRARAAGPMMNLLARDQLTGGSIGLAAGVAPCRMGKVQRN
jgi:hypothetical protein